MDYNRKNLWLSNFSDMLSKKYHDSKFICNLLKPIDKFLSTKICNAGAYLIVVARKD